MLLILLYVIIYTDAPGCCYIADCGQLYNMHYSRRPLQRVTEVLGETNLDAHFSKKFSSFIYSRRTSYKRRILEYFVYMYYIQQH